MFGIIGTIFSGIVEGVSGYYKGKQEIRKTELEGNIKVLVAEAEAKCELAKSGQIQDYNLDKIAMKNMEKSWKDELILIVFLAPMIMAFVPALSSYSLAGFDIIKTMPEWYRYTIIGMVVVIYGMRGMMTKLLNMRGLNR